MNDVKLELLTPANCQLIFIDQQPQMAFGLRSHTMVHGAPGRVQHGPTLEPLPAR